MTNGPLPKSVSFGIRKIDGRGCPAVKTENVDLVGASSSKDPNPCILSSPLATSSKSLIGRPVVKTENVDLVGGSSSNDSNRHIFSSLLATSSKSFIVCPLFSF